MRISDWSSDVCSSDLEHVGEVVRADLHRRFADLERRFAHRMRIALDHGHAQRRILSPQLDRQGQARQAAAEDGDVGVGRLGANPARSTPVVLVCDAANSPSGSSITGRPGSEERRGGKEGVSTWKSRGTPLKKKK